MFTVLHNESDYNKYYESNSLLDGIKDAELVEKQTPKVDLPSGDYKIDIYYDTDENGCTVNLVEENGKKILYSDALDQNNNHKEITYSTKLQTNDFQIVIRYPNSETFHLNGINISSTGSVFYKDSIFVAFVLAVFMVMAFLIWVNPKNNDTFMRIKKRNNLQILFVLIILVLFISYPLFQHNLIATDDFQFHLARIEGIKDGILTGQLPVRIYPEHLNGYGYPAPVFYPDIFLYPSALLRLLGVSLIVSYKFLLFLINVLTAGISYNSFKKLFNSREMGLVSSILYTCADYRLTDLYFRSAIGEALAMSFLPLVLLGVYYIFFADSKKWFVATLGYTCIFQSHLLTLEMITFFSCIFGIIFIRQLAKRERRFALYKMIISTILLNLWFVIPLLCFYQYDYNIVNYKFDVYQQAISITQLFSTGNGGRMLGMSFLINIGILLFFIRMIKRDKIDNGEIILISFGLMAIYMTTYWFPWKCLGNISFLTNVISVIQFPWRFLEVATVFLVPVAAISFIKLVPDDSKKKYVIFAVCIVSFMNVHVILNNLVSKNGTITKTYMPYQYIEHLGGGQEYLVKNTDGRKILNGAQKLQASNGIIIKDFKKNGINIDLTFSNPNSDSDSYIDLPLLFAPGYQVTLNHSTNLQTTIGDNNVLRVILPRNSSGDIWIRYKGYAIFNIALYISLGTVLFFAVNSIRKRKFDKIKKIGRKN